MFENLEGKGCKVIGLNGVVNLFRREGTVGPILIKKQMRNNYPSIP
jgi:hypothetical protein